MYATKRRRRNTKNYKSPLKENQKTNPSKRHRERLNGELENLASLLPFESSILTKLDKLSILRLAVSYLRVKSYFQATLKNRQHLQNQQQQYETASSSSSSGLCQEIYYHDPNFSEGASILEALQGFIVIVSCDGELFYASRTVEQFLGFHQSDIVHQSAYELIHSEDRDEFKRHLQWNEKLSNSEELNLEQLLTSPEHGHLLERTFTVRFRCLLDNTSGFVTLEIDGRIGILHGQKSHHNIHEDRPLALFGIACPFGPPSLFEIPQRETLFKSKHRLTLEPVSLDPRGKLILNYSDHDLAEIGGGYHWIHSDDLKYYSTAHKELLKTGTSGLVCYRIQTKDGRWQWLQSSMRIIYKSNKPDFVIANHRPLTNDEGQELFYKRGSEFKLPYPCLYDFDTSFNSTTPTSIIPSSSSSSSLTNDDSYVHHRHHSNKNLSMTNKSNSLVSSLGNNRSRKTNKTTNVTTLPTQTLKVTPTPNTTGFSPVSMSTPFDPYYGSYPSAASAAYVSSYAAAADVTAASFIEAASGYAAVGTGNTTTGTHPSDLLLVTDPNNYAGAYSGYYAAALQQQYQTTLSPYHAAYYQQQDSAVNRYYTRNSPSPTSEHHQQTSHDGYLMDTNNPNNNPYSYYLYGKTSSHGHHPNLHDPNNNLPLSLDPLPIHHSVIKHSAKR